MEISDLKIFSAVAHSGSITLAAQKLHRVPSNVSTRIQKLEQSIGQTLFIRESNRLRISPAGESLLDYAQKILALADEAVSQFQDPHPKGLLRIGSMEAVAATYLPQYLAPYHQNFPDVTLNVKTWHTDGLIEEVLNRKLDLALVANPKEHEDLSSIKIIKEPMVLVSSLNTKQLKEIQSPIKLLGFAQGCYYRKCLIQWAEQLDLNYTLHEIQSYHSLLNCISAGMGIGITPASLLKQFHNNEKIKTHSLPSHLKNSYTHIVWRKDSLSPAMNALIDLFKQKKPSI